MPVQVTVAMLGAVHEALRRPMVKLHSPPVWHFHWPQGLMSIEITYSCSLVPAAPLYLYIRGSGNFFYQKSTIGK